LQSLRIERRRFARTLFRLASILLALAPVAGTYPAGDLAAAQTRAPEGRDYPQTGVTLAGEFVPFYDQNGGLAQFGYPISQARIENGYLVQWTERQRLEHHPEHAGTRFEVLLGLLGRELTDGYDGPRFQALGDNGESSLQQLQPVGGLLFGETGHFVAEDFFEYWQANGAVPVFGYPISNEFTSGGLRVQWFERARFERHPENPEHTRILLGHLGREALKSRELPLYSLDVHSTAAPDSDLQIGLSQGGESENPGFFENIRDEGAALGPALVRLDNILNYYNIVRRGPDGKLAYDWLYFDRVLDSLAAMNKEPLICLSYMPELLSSTGDSRVKPPRDYAEWSELVRATVHHVNVERKQGVRYWEVWNEPDQWSFWQAPYPEYFRLYDAAADAARLADPTVKIGGPGLSRFLPSHLDEFLAHQASRGASAAIDFISWHSYGFTADEIASNIRKAREIMERYPTLNPQIFITEFNVIQGGADDTSFMGRTDTVDGAIGFLTSLEGMQRERLDRALFFELKDGPGPRSYWGRWGILTFDGKPKPVYHAIRAYLNRPAGALPISVRRGPNDGTLGMMAFGTAQRATLMLWYTGAEDARVKVHLPETFHSASLDVVLFDKVHNNPVRSGDPALQPEGVRHAGDLLFELRPGSLVLMETP
jgi:hypothetical protein